MNVRCKFYGCHRIRYSGSEYCREEHLLQCEYCKSLDISMQLNGRTVCYRSECMRRAGDYEKPIYPFIRPLCCSIWERLQRWCKGFMSEVFDDFLTQCSFCGKFDKESPLIIGPRVSICHDCVKISWEIVREKQNNESEVTVI